MILRRAGARIVKALVPALFLLSMSGCVSISVSGNRPEGPWYEAYQPINDPASDAFIARSLMQAICLFGEPVIPVNKVMLRRSKKVEAARRYRIGENFSLTECADTTNGVFVIYLAVDPGHRNYYALLGHECAHLLNPYITDWYMEGIATLFSEQMCRETGKEWGDWKRHFMRSRKEPYALSYRMMLALQEAFPEKYPALMGFTEDSGKREGWRRIDIDAWLDELSDADYQQALNIMDPFVKQLHRQVSRQYDFTIPAALK